MLTIPFGHIGPLVYTPNKKQGDSGYDLVNMGETKILYPHAPTMFNTMLKFAIPSGYGGFLFTRSGMAAAGISVLGGVIDSSYRGEVKVVLINHSGTSYRVKNGDRIAQMVIIALPEVDFVCGGDLGTTERGEKGFGSSGK